ncbi:uracil-DNA glycosylase family protein [Rhodobacter sp. CZR27]|uniref:uracil-DNA glycosylase family protein n=1 Tax=Rhodobacter sp. CZR27 TaxID=2033869 RepID=UPI0012FD21DC|nr:uracil-DNA glycosylase family protein [Rhodobacter sp. CZR27]
MLVGQAPGLTEYISGRPFSGPAGEEARALFEQCGLRRDQFDVLVYQTSVVKCFCGRKEGSNGRPEDVVPPAPIVRACKPFLVRQIEIFKPKLIVCLGAFAAGHVQRLFGLATGAQEDYVGRIDFVGDMGVAYLPHTSGRSQFLNKPENKKLFIKARQLLSAQIHRVGAAGQ